MKLAEQAVMAFYDGQYRRAADWYLQSFQTFGRRDPARYSTRWQIFQGYTSILREEYFAANANDFRNVRAIQDDTKEHALFRAEAAFTAGLLHYIAANRDKAAAHYRKAIRFADSLSDAEGRQTYITSVPGNDMQQPGFGPVTVASISSQIRAFAQDNLTVMESPSLAFQSSAAAAAAAAGMGGPAAAAHMMDQPPVSMRSNGTSIPLPGRVSTAPTQTPEQPDGLTPTVMNRLLSVGGNRCDTCDKTRDELPDLQRLLRCARCRRAYYCSKECQRLQWKRGHKQHCRLAGEFCAGDYVRLQGLQTKPEMNGTLVQVVGSMGDGSSNRWQTRLPGTSNNAPAVSIAAANMEQLRPLK